MTQMLKAKGVTTNIRSFAPTGKQILLAVLLFFYVTPRIHHDKVGNLESDY